nr:hypothetical protein [Tanacetum cinerariifolium]
EWGCWEWGYGVDGLAGNKGKKDVQFFLNVLHGASLGNVHNWSLGVIRGIAFLVQVVFKVLGLAETVLHSYIRLDFKLFHASRLLLILSDFALILSFSLLSFTCIQHIPPAISLVQHDAKTQGRNGHDMGVDTAESLYTASATVTTASITISTASPTRVSIADDITMAKILVYIRNSAVKDK